MLPVYFCIRDDDTSFFTSPDELEKAYDEISCHGPISLAVVPFHRAGTSKAVPEKLRRQWSVHPLHKNHALLEYLRAGIRKGKFEIMLHGYHHDEPSGGPEFLDGNDLANKVNHGREYLEALLGCRISVFVPPHNTIGRKGLRAIAAANLHLGCVAGIRSGWSPFTLATWRMWLKLRKWQKTAGLDAPWVLDLGDHREIPGNPVTPLARFQHNKQAFDAALTAGGVFCASTHYWEMDIPSVHPGEPTVGEHLRRVIDLARSDSRVVWRTVGEVVSTWHGYPD